MIASGPGRRGKSGNVVPTDAHPGDVVIVGNAVGELLEDQDVEYRLVKADDILAVLP